MCPSRKILHDATKILYAATMTQHSQNKWIYSVMLIHQILWCSSSHQEVGVFLCFLEYLPIRQVLCLLYKETETKINKALPEFLVWPLVNFYWSGTPVFSPGESQVWGTLRTTIQNVTIPLVICTNIPYMRVWFPEQYFKTFCLEPRWSITQYAFFCILFFSPMFIYQLTNIREVPTDRQSLKHLRDIKEQKWQKSESLWKLLSSGDRQD